MEEVVKLLTENSEIVAASSPVAMAAAYGAVERLGRSYGRFKGQSPEFTFKELETKRDEFYEEPFGSLLDYPLHPFKKGVVQGYDDLISEVRKDLRSDSEPLY